MRDYYDGKISCEEVKYIFKEYAYHTFGRRKSMQETTNMQEFEKTQEVTGTEAESFTF